MTYRVFLRTAFAGLGLCAVASAASAACYNPEPLRFRDDGTFRIMQITDTQDDHLIDFRTPELIRRAIEVEQPDLVVCSGDCITGGQIGSDQEVRDAIDAVFMPIEEAGVPFIVAFGNHDEDAHVRGDAPNMDEQGQLDYYRNTFTCNINRPDNPRITGDGDMVTFVYGARRKWPWSDRFDAEALGSEDFGTQGFSHSLLRRLEPKLAIWAIDSGRYAPNPIAGQPIGYNDNGWDWIRQDQVDWYRETSEKIERRFRRRIPGIIFFHIPLFEFETMWTVDQGMFPSRDRPNAQPPVDEGRYKVEEERHECVCTGPFNSGLYAAAQERGDILGMFVGHDHINSYVGNYHGILLGYGASSGFGPYGFGGDERNRLRGVRIHDFHEDDVEGYVENFSTAFKRAGEDYGLCLAPDPADCNGDAFYPWTPSPSATLARTSAFGAEDSEPSADAEVKTQGEDGRLVEVGKRVVAEEE